MDLERVSTLELSWKSSEGFKVTDIRLDNAFEDAQVRSTSSMTDLDFWDDKPIVFKLATVGGTVYVCTW